MILKIMSSFNVILLKCLKCRFIHWKFDSKSFVFNLSSDVDGPRTSVRKLLRNYGNKQEVDISCGQCCNDDEKTAHEKQHGFTFLGNYLMFSLKRFKYNEYSLFGRRDGAKSSQYIYTNKVIYCAFKKWKLIAILFHFGPSLRQGHYIAQIFKYGKYWQVSDETEPKQIPHFTANSNNNYIVLYEKIHRD